MFDLTPNTPPVFETVGNKSVLEGQELAFSVSATDPDSDPLSLTARLANGNSLDSIEAAFIDNGNGTGEFTWTPTHAQTGSYEIIFDVSDGELNDSQTSVINVYLLGDMDNDNDIDSDDLSQLGAAYGSIIGDTAYNASGDMDSDGDIDGLDIVLFSNSFIPKIETIPAQTVQEGVLLTVDIGAVDPDGGAITFSLNSELPDGAELIDNHNQTATLSWTPADTQLGEYNISVKATDPGGLNDNESFIVTVTQQNAPPNIIEPIEIQKTVGTTQPICFYVKAADTDNDPLTYSARLSNGESMSSLGMVFKNVIYGDVNEDGILNSMDMSALNTYLYHQQEYEVIYDFDHSGGITVADIFALKALVNSGSQPQQVGVFIWTPTYTQVGSYELIFDVSDGKSHDTLAVEITVNSEQTPWQSNQNGTLVTNATWDYTMGYHFIPNENGRIVKLGGFFNGAKTVYLWNKTTGQLLAQAQVSSSNNWNYVNIPVVNVQKGQTYTVGAYLAGSGASYRTGIAYLPRKYGNITISGSTYRYGNGRPTNQLASSMYGGQVDIMFVPDIKLNNNVPQITSPLAISQNPLLGNTSAEMTVNAVDADGDFLTYTWQMSDGFVSGSGNSVLYNAPNVTQQTIVSITVSIDDGEGGVAESSIQVTVIPNPNAGEKPWSVNENGNLITNMGPWDYTMGYNFTPKRAGTIIKLGGFFDGVKTVSLWNKETGELLATAEVESADNWNYVSINPVTVAAGVEYTVSAYIAGSGATYRYNIDYFPRQYGNITINGSAFSPGNIRPTNNFPNCMYGQVDIEFK